MEKIKSLLYALFFPFMIPTFLIIHYPISDYEGYYDRLFDKAIVDWPKEMKDSATAKRESLKDTDTEIISKGTFVMASLLFWGVSFSVYFIVMGLLQVIV